MQKRVIKPIEAVKKKGRKSIEGINMTKYIACIYENITMKSL
jgi:hypothetical protein